MAASPIAALAQDEDRQDAARSPSDFVRLWQEAIKQAGDEEKEWREEKAKEASDAYAGKSDSPSIAFNIYHSNIETLVPSLYNSTPIPDVRRRFNDEDPVGKAVSEVLERSLSFSVDDYDFNAVMKRVVKDMAVVDRGLARVKYIPTYIPAEQAEDFEPDEGSVQQPTGEPDQQQAAPPDTMTEEGEQDLGYEEVQCEYVPWRSFRRGPAIDWKDVPWIAFEHFLPRKEVARLVTQNNKNPQVLADVLSKTGCRFNHVAGAKDADDSEKREKVVFGGRERVWEIWDKDTETVIFISADYKNFPLAIIEDPLKLKGFFPIPRPAQVIEATDSLTPITPYSIYSSLIEELNDVTKRISKLVAQCRPRGGYASTQPELKQIMEADDGEMIPIQGVEQFVTQGAGLDKAIVWFPLEPVVAALKQLVAQRDVIKQTIYEVTGLADIMRGSTEASETATAQQIKTQWGSVRVQSHQAEVARFARDLFRLKAELYAKRFQWSTLVKMTGLKYPTQAEQQQAQQMMQAGMQAVQAGQINMDDPQVKQQAEQIQDTLSKPPVEAIVKMLRNDAIRTFRVDVESDSTIRGDLTRNQEQMKGFLEGTASFASAIGPLVQQGGFPPDVAIELFTAFCRHFKLGKQAEDALDGLADKLKKNPNGGMPTDPEKEAKAGKLAAETEKLKKETALLDETHGMAKEKHAAEVEGLRGQGQLAKDQHGLEKQRFDHERDTAGKTQDLERQRFDHERQTASQSHDLARRTLEQKNVSDNAARGVEHRKINQANEHLDKKHAHESATLATKATHEAQSSAIDHEHQDKAKASAKGDAGLAKQVARIEKTLATLVSKVDKLAS